MALLSTSELRDRVATLPTLVPLREVLGVDFQLPVFLVGGAVRDLLVEREPLDLDLAVDGSLGELTQLLDGAYEVHDRFGTATVTCNGLRYDIAQARAERYPSPGALPEVRPAPITEDLRRRDFTVNAIALGLTGPQAGELVTVDGALADLEGRRIAVLHDRSFTDDPTRLLRMVRYAARLQFEIAPHTRELADAAVAGGALDTVSGTRIGNELRLLAAESDPVAALSALAELGLDEAIDVAFSFNQERQATAREALQELPADGRPELLVLSVALLGVERESAAVLLERLEFTAADAGAIIDAATRAASVTQALAMAQTGSAIAHAVGNAGVTTVALAAALGRSRGPQRWLNDLRHRRLQITGDDLIEAGIPEGPQLGQRLAAARDAMWDDVASDRESQLAVALETAR
jgi:tRNA nucleotidyltransferase (CCA-adding enzyme)